MNLYQKLALIRKMTEAIKKNKKGFNYSYVTEDEILAKVTAGMNKYNISLIPRIIPQTTVVTPYKTIKTKIKGEKIFEENVNEILVQADIEFVWINNDNPDEKIVIPWTLIGQQSDSSMAFGSALTYTSRYFLLKYFQVATVDDDPDNWRSKQRNAEKELENENLKNVHKKILEECEIKIQNGINKDKLYKTIAENADGKKNPNAIKDTKTAVKVLNIIKNMEVTE